MIITKNDIIGASAKKQVRSNIVMKIVEAAGLGKLKVDLTEISELDENIQKEVVNCLKSCNIHITPGYLHKVNISTCDVTYAHMREIFKID